MEKLPPHEVQEILRHLSEQWNSVRIPSAFVTKMAAVKGKGECSRDLEASGLGSLTPREGGVFGQNPINLKEAFSSPGVRLLVNVARVCPCHMSRVHGLRSELF